MIMIDIKALAWQLERKKMVQKDSSQLFLNLKNI